MRTRTWLTTPADQAPVTDERNRHGERYVPGPGPVREPRPPGRHRRAVTVLFVVLAVIAITGVLLLGEHTQRDDPSIPDVPGDAPPDQLELPET